MKDFIHKHEKWLPFLLVLLFVAITASGLATMHNPDELVHRVAKALKGRWQFDETNFDYPSLPKYVMFGIGKVVYAFGHSEVTFKAVARFFSVLLGGGTIFLVYRLTRKLGGSIFASLVATSFLLANQVFSINARFAHNDLYLTFFLVLSFYFLLLYQQGEGKAWLYVSFFSVGLAASSKYNGGVFLLMPVLLYFIQQRKNIFANILSSLETLFLGATLSFLGFALGTPKALLWFAYYLKRVLPALQRHATYGKTTESVIGFSGQWGVMRGAFSTAVYFLFMIAFLYFLYRNLQQWRTHQIENPTWMVLLAIFIFDLPIMASYNYQTRFFLPLLPFFAILGGLFYDELDTQMVKTKLKPYRFLIPIGFILLFLATFPRVISVRLLLKNDPRQEAAEFIATLPKGTKLEYTMYPPVMPRDHFEAEYNYPIFFPKFEGQETPEVGPGKPYDAVNEGEAGLLDREIDYFVADSFTYGRCANEAIYKTNPVECDFFEDLLAGESAYQLIGEFTYDLPPYLPQIRLAFVNPDIYVFQRKE